MRSHPGGAEGGIEVDEVRDFVGHLAQDFEVVSVAELIDEVRHDLRFTRRVEDNGVVFWVGAGDTVEVRFESASGEVTWRKGLVGYFNPQGGPAFWVKFDDTGESEVVPCSAMRIVASVPRPRAEGLYYFSSLLDDMERWALFPANTRLDTEEIVDLSFDITLDHGVDEARRCFLALLAYHRYTMDPERRSWPLDRVKRFQWKGKKPKERGA